MMSPVQRLITAKAGQGGNWRLCGEAANYIEAMEPLLAQCVQGHVEALTDLSRAQDRISFLEGQLRIEQDERKQESAKYAIIEARYKQVEERWHKLMERRELQCNNRITNWDMQGDRVVCDTVTLL